MVVGGATKCARLVGNGQSFDRREIVLGIRCENGVNYMAFMMVLVWSLMGILQRECRI